MKLTEPLCGDVPAHSLPRRSGPRLPWGERSLSRRLLAPSSRAPPPLCRFSALLRVPLCPPHQILRLSVPPSSFCRTVILTVLWPPPEGTRPLGRCSEHPAGRFLTPPAPDALGGLSGDGQPPAAQPALGTTVLPLTVLAGDKPFGRPWQTFCRNPSLEGCQSVFPTKCSCWSEIPKTYNLKSPPPPPWGPWVVQVIKGLPWLRSGSPGPGIEPLVRLPTQRESASLSLGLSPCCDLSVSLCSLCLSNEQIKS